MDHRARRSRVTLPLVLLLAGLAGCSTPATDRPAGADSAIRLTATLVTPTDIALAWPDNEPDAAGRVVEFATEPQGRYTIVQFLPPHQTTFTHHDLMPATPFYYRVRAFFGPASAPVDVVLPDTGDEGDDQEWAAPRTVAHGPVATAPIRNPGTAAAGTPTDLRASVMHAPRVQTTWTDHASDEEGYLLEVKPKSNADFGVAAVLDPDINSAGLTTLPDEK